MKLFWMWVLSLILLAGTVYAQGAPGVILGGVAGCMMGLTICATVATAWRKS